MLIFRIVIANMIAVIGSVWLYLWLADVISPMWAILATASVAGGFTCLLTLLAVRHLKKTIEALDVGLSNLADDDFSVSLIPGDYADLKSLVEKFNNATRSLGTRKRDLIQRELLLDRMLHSSPNLLLLIDSDRRIVFCNDAARRFFNRGVRSVGKSVDSLWQEDFPAFLQAFDTSRTGLFTVTTGRGQASSDSQSWHLDQVEVVVNQQRHTMVSFKHMTTEVNRQEVQTWKKVIRVVSHEINNSLGPMLSMINSGRKINAKIDNPQLSRVLDTLADRSDHLNQFVQGYAQFAKMPLPKFAPIDWARFTDHIRAITNAQVQGASFAELDADSAQLEQAIINLCKNAVEAGSPVSEVVVKFYCEVDWQHIEVLDRGPGMSQEVIQQSLLPFYTTKQRGSGIGLALVREIVDAHGGSMTLANRQSGGLNVRLSLPVK